MEYGFFLRLELFNNFFENHVYFGITVGTKT